MGFIFPKVQNKTCCCLSLTLTVLIIVLLIPKNINKFIERERGERDERDTQRQRDRETG